MIESFKNLLNKVYAKWPQRHVRPVLKVTISRNSKNKFLNLRSYGYTNGDKIVVMLEKDFQRVADIAAKKSKKLSLLGFVDAMLVSLPTLEEIEKKTQEIKLDD